MSIGNAMFLFYAWTAVTGSNSDMLFIFYLVSESESEQESIRSPESESEQPHHDSAPLHQRALYDNVNACDMCVGEMQVRSQSLFNGISRIASS